MTRRVHTLRLSGLDGSEAEQAARALLDDRSVPDLSRLIVLDDTAILLEHTGAFERLLTSGRLNYLLCVAIGPPAGGERVVTLPGSISSGQGSAVIWVSDPIGVDWPLEASSVATIRPDAVLSGLHHLVEVLSAVEVFEHVRDRVLTLPGGVASPGLRLDEASEVVNGFPFALAAAIRRLIDSSGAATSTTDQVEALISRLNDQLGGTAQLDPEGKLARARERCETEAEAAVAALDELAGLGGLFGVGQPGVHARDQVVASGEALKELKDTVGQILDYAHAPGGLNDRQRQRLKDEGLQLVGRAAAQVRAMPPETTGLPTFDPVTRAAVDAVEAGDPLPSIAEQFALAERRLSPRGSRVYLADLDRRCPVALINRLLNPPELPPLQPWLPLAGAFAALAGSLDGTAGIAIGVVVALIWAGIVALSVSSRLGGQLSKSQTALVVNFVAALVGVAIGVTIGIITNPPPAAVVAGLLVAVVTIFAGAIRSWRARALTWRDALAPQQGTESANALTELLLKVASTEWSADSATLEDIARTKITIEAIQDQLGDYVTSVEQSVSAGRDWQTARLSSSFEPTLRDLVSSVLVGHPARGHSDGQAAYRHVKAKTDDLISQWNAIAAERGPFARPPFAAASGHDDAYLDEEDLGAITLAATYNPRDVMWQLCAPGDLAILDTHGRNAVVAFAPQMMRQALVRLLPGDTVWTSSGQYAGLLRLVPLRPGGVSLDWSASSRAGASGMSAGQTKSLRYLSMDGELIKTSATVVAEQNSAPAPLLTRLLRLEDGVEAHQVTASRFTKGGAQERGYRMIDSEILAGRRLAGQAERGDGRYPPQLARLIGYDADSAEPFALFESYRGEAAGAVAGHLLRAGQHKFQVSLLTGLRWLAEAGLAHRSIGPGTVRWDGEQVQITDFSLATVIGAERQRVGSPPWAAPEQRGPLVHGQVTDRDDVWAAGRLIFYVVTGQELSERDQLSEWPQLLDLLAGVFGPPEQRPSAQELLKVRLRQPDPVPAGSGVDVRLAQGVADFYAARDRRHGRASGLLTPEPSPEPSEDKPRQSWLRRLPFVISVLAILALVGIGVGVWIK